MRITVGIALVVGSAAVALASPVASPIASPAASPYAKPPTPPMPPMPKDDNEDLAGNVAKVGNCPVCYSPLY